MRPTKDFVTVFHHHAEPFDFSHAGWTPLVGPTSLRHYEDWLQAGHHAQMSYLQRHLPDKRDPRALMPNAKSALVLAKGYARHPYPTMQDFAPRTALYARGEDYHSHFLAELRQLALRLQEEFPQEEFLCFTDSAPILERDLAAQAGLGWIGKNTCLIHPRKGSLFFLGEILTTLAVPSPPPAIPDMCGTCDRCLRACPTQALEAPRVLNANRCIAYWTIESRTPAPLELRPQFGDWFFGCDICQTVCPWNEKVFGREDMRAQSASTLHPDPDPTTLEDLRSILVDSNRQVRTRFQDLPLSRARALGLKRNALYVIGNLQLKTLKPEVQLAHQDPDLRELAQWTLDCLARV